MEDPVKMTKKTVDIDGNRKLYSYEFEIADAPKPESEPETQEK